MRHRERVLPTCAAAAVALFLWRPWASEAFAVGSGSRGGGSGSAEDPGASWAVVSRRPRTRQGAGQLAAGAGVPAGLAAGLAASAALAGAIQALRLARGRLAAPDARRGSQTIRRAGEALMPWKIPNTSRWQWLSVRELLLRERILMVTQYIDENYANAILAMLLYLQSEDATKDVQIYFAVPGAQLKPALAVYDTICQLKAKGCKITTVSYSLCAELGAFLVSAGTKGRRFATPHSLFRLSKVGLESPFQGQASDIEVEVRQMMRESQRVDEEMAANTGRPLDQIQRDLGRDFYLSAKEAVDYGLVDRVLTPNTNKGEQLDKGVRDAWSGTVTKTKVAFGEFADPTQPRTAV